MPRGALYLLLQSRLYLGEISHKGQHYPASTRRSWIAICGTGRRCYWRTTPKTGKRVPRQGTPTCWLGAFDNEGNHMSPTHAVKDSKRYRYCVSRPLISDGRAKAPDAVRIPAAEIGDVVAGRLCAWLADGPALLDAIGNEDQTGVIVLTVPVKLHRIGRGGNLIVGGDLQRHRVPTTSVSAAPRLSTAPPSRRDRKAPHTDGIVATSRKCPKNRDLSASVAGGPGFEPRLPGPEPGVLPLNYPPAADRPDSTSPSLRQPIDPALALNPSPR